MDALSYRTNHRIQAKEIRLLRDDGSQIGVLPLTEALSQAKSAGLDLVEIAPKAVPPVVKLVDYKKFLYQLAKKARSDKSQAKKVDLKEIRLTPFMAQNDLDTRLRQGRDFLSEGHKLKIAVKFVGRQLTHREFGGTMWQRALDVLADISAVDQQPKWIGKVYTGTLTPVKKVKLAESNTDQNSHEQQTQNP